MFQVNFKLSPILQERYPALDGGDDAKFVIITRKEYDQQTQADLLGRLFIVVNNLISDVYCESDLGDKELRKYVIERERELISKFTGPFSDPNE